MIPHVFRLAALARIYGCTLSRLLRIYGIADHELLNRTARQ